MIAFVRVSTPLHAQHPSSNSGEISQLATSTYLIDAYTIHAASVTAASTVFRSLCGALLPLAGGAMYDRLGVGWGTSVLAFISVGFLPMPFVFWFYGQRIRESKRFRVEF